MTTTDQALNDRFPQPFAGLDCKSARELAFEAIRLAGGAEQVTEALLQEIRDMPECATCGGLIDSRYALNGHEMRRPEPDAGGNG